MVPAHSALPPCEGNSTAVTDRNLNFIRPDHEPGSPDPIHNELGLRNVTFEVDDLQAILGRLAADGYHLVGGVGQYEDIWRMASVRGPEGFIVNLAQRIN